ncbi:HAD family hydrolase [Mitsuokella sp.]|uniref:HAD family hydrolase n=1 Tax=Mitsuokella sp. TaxID=2049034 RepID=UPI002A83E3FB|nr:HAD family hydrolase [Mitsuokella sp.]MDY4475488.1 HAD family hydrolase [Mitsuokella sp.]
MTKAQTKKAVFFDIDGTLINIMTGQTTIQPAVKEAIRELRAAGNATFIASGRPYDYLDPELTEEGLFDGYVLMNGAVVLLDGSTIYEQPLRRATVKEIVAASEAHGVEYILEGAQHVYLRPDFHLTEAFYRSIDVDVTKFVRDFDLDEVEVAKIEFASEDPGGHGLFDKLLAWPGLTGLMDPYHKKNMELYAADVTKGSGIRHALSYLGIPVADSYAFGDGLNDIEMMETVGTSLVMGNARPALKKLADHIVPSVEEDGVAVGINRYVLA